jgi:hypothetical protein
VKPQEISVTLPRERSYYRIVELVLGGLAARHDVTLEHLQDMELALEGLLDRLDGTGPAIVRMRVDDDTLHAAVGPYGKPPPVEQAESDGRLLDLHRLLDTVVDRYEIVDADGAHWVELAKAVR